MVASINSSNNSTKKEYKSKGFRRPIEEILADFQQPIPSRLLKQKPIFKKDRQNGQSIKSGTVDYIPWTTYIRLLEFYAPGYDWEIQVETIADRVVVCGKLTIKAAEGDVIRTATGQEESDIDSFGDPISNAEASALRRCCAKFGLSLSLWE